MSSSRNASTSKPSFDFVELYALASWLYDTRPIACSEAVKRTIVGRAYYAALICARDFTGASTTGESGHKMVVDALRPRSSRAANNLNDLRLLRQKADYEAGAFTDRDVGIALRHSRLVLQVIGRLMVDDKPYVVNYLDPTKFLGG